MRWIIGCSVSIVFCASVANTQTAALSTTPPLPGGTRFVFGVSETADADLLTGQDGDAIVQEIVSGWSQSADFGCNTAGNILTVQDTGGNCLQPASELVFTVSGGALLMDHTLSFRIECTPPTAASVNLDSMGFVALTLGTNVLVSGPDTITIDFGFPSAATVFTYNGTGTNLDTMTTTPAIVGNSWTVSLSPQGGRGPGAWILFLRAASAAGPVVDLGLLFGLPAAGLSELLVNPAALIANLSPPPHAGSGTTAMFSVPVPANPALIGNAWFAQAMILGDLPAGAGTLDPWFTSAVGGIIGTF